MDNDDISAINPEEIRVRLSLTDPVELQTKDVRLVLKFEYAGKKESEFQYLLEFIDVNRQEESWGWLSAAAAKNIYQFKLSRLSQLEFNKYQKSYLKHGKPRQYKWTVYYYLKEGIAKNTSASIDMELKLSKNDSYFFLLKEAIIEINNIRN